MSVFRNLLLSIQREPPTGVFRLLPSILSFTETGGDKTLNVEAEADDSWELEAEGVTPIEGIVVTPDTLHMAAAGETRTITIQSDKSWTI